MLHDGSWFGGGMWIFWILLIVVIVVVVKMLAGSGSTTMTDQNKTPLEILKQRYARGEIDDEEYQRRRRELEK